MPEFIFKHRKWLLAAVLLGAIVILLSLIPGDLSPIGVVRWLGGLFVRDSDFETIDLGFYNRLRPILLGAGALILATALAAYTGVVRRSRRLARIALWFSVSMGLFALLVFTNLMVARRNAPIYRLISGTPLAYQPQTPTSTPSPTASPVPTTTPVPAVPGSWELNAQDLNFPIAIAFPDDGSGRMFVVVKRGGIRVFKNGELQPTWYLDIRDRVIQQLESPEQGFLGLALHPDFAENGFFYVNYIDQAGNTVISRFQEADDKERVDPSSEYRLLGVPQPTWDHNGGSMVFGPDGYLYIGLGDGGLQRDPHEYAQSPDTLLGKILRIDVDGGSPYGIPPDNPFVGTSGMDEIWLYGLRNPWRFSFDAITGDMYIADVGHKVMEEINYLPSGSPGGLNFGWNHYEGRDFYTGYENPPVPPLRNQIAPVWEYGHGGGVCAVTGGYVYRGQALPALAGTYIYGDYCAGKIWGLRHDGDGNWVNELLFTTRFAITTFAEDLDHEIYIATAQGEIYKLIPAP